MKKHKVIKIILLIILIPIIAIFGVRFINEFRYPDVDLGDSSVTLQDMSTYPLEYEGVMIEEIHQGSANGFHIIPNNKTSNGVIVTFGGSEGGCNYFQAIDLAQNGYEVVALFFFGQENQPQLLNKVPIDFFDEFLVYAKDRNIDTETLTLLGGSKGAELSLLLTNYYDEIDNAILYAPSSYVFQGLDFQNQASSWTYQGKELPYISFMESSPQSLFQMFSAMIFNYPISYREQYETAVQNSENASDAVIDISNFEGNIIMFSGDDDAMWHSSVMAQEIYNQNQTNIENVVYEDVGHIFKDVTYANGLAFGGVAKNNQNAGVDSDGKVLEFLKQHHK